MALVIERRRHSPGAGRKAGCMKRPDDGRAEFIPAARRIRRRPGDATTASHSEATGASDSPRFP